MLKTGKSYRVRVLDHFSGGHGHRKAPVFFNFVGRYVRQSDIYVVFSIISVDDTNKFILPFTDKDKFMYVMAGHFEAKPYLGDSLQ
jgi:hypothetical protein